MVLTSRLHYMTPLGKLTLICTFILALAWFSLQFLKNVSSKIKIILKSRIVANSSNLHSTYYDIGRRWEWPGPVRFVVTLQLDECVHKNFLLQLSHAVRGKRESLSLTMLSQLTMLRTFSTISELFWPWQIVLPQGIHIGRLDGSLVHWNIYSVHVGDSAKT